MCYSKLTLKGTSPVINERYKLLKSHWWNKKETKHGYERWTNIDYFSVLFPQSLRHFRGAHKTEKMNAFNKRIIRFHRIIVLHKYVVTIFSFLWFCVVAAAHSVVKDSLCVWLCYLSCGSIFFRHHSWRSYLLLKGLNYIVQDPVFTYYPGHLRNNFMFILQSISCSLQGSYVLSVELPPPKTTTYGLHFFILSFFFFFFILREYYFVILVIPT